MKILHTADLHIGAELSYLGRLAQSRRYEVFEVFKNITEICTKENVEICLIAGDLFDSTAATKEFFEPVCRFISSAANTRFFYVAGNHDPLFASSPFVTENLPDNLTVFGGDFETVIDQKIGVRVTGRSFTRSSSEFCDMEPMPQDGLYNILLLHADYSGGEDNYFPINRSFIENCGADYLALGHIHKRTSVQKIVNTYVSYCGCPEGQGFDESGVKGVYCGEISKDSFDLKFIKCSKRLHIVKNFDLTLCENTKAATELIENSLQNEFGDSYTENLYKLTLAGSPSDIKAVNIQELTADLTSKLYFVKIKSRITPKIDLELLSKEISLKGIFVKNMLEKIGSADEQNQTALNEALYLGLKAFDSEVAYDED